MSIYLRELRAASENHRCMPGWHTIPRASAKTRISQSCIYGYIRTGQLPRIVVDSQLCLHDSHLPKARALWLKSLGGAK